ncbi:MAG: phosphotransferase [Proteobacteria bacterium]|nr:phosphotransferase [Pseudomonadota bacterium]
MTTPFEQLDEAQRRAHLATVAARAAPRWGVTPGARITLLNISENATYRIDDDAHSEPLILRVHRTGYHSIDAIRTELAWMKALKEEAGVETPQAVPALDGELIQTIACPELDEQRQAVMFAFIAGAEPAQDSLIEPFKRLGAIAARMHAHARCWQRPDYFERLVWDFEGAVGKRGNWGDWRNGLGLDAAAIDLLEQMVDKMGVRLEAFGMDDTRFGLIHADLRLANLLVTADDTRVIDFDDAGLGWYLYDIATAVSFMEEREDLATLLTAWVAGYRSVAPLSAAEEREIPTFLMLRRMAILAWIGSHGETDLARELGLPYTAGTLRLARRYLDEFPG